MITLIGDKLAKEELVFLFKGAHEECETCRVKDTCVGVLEEGRKYKITKIIGNTQKCKIHAEDKVTVVEVEKENITTVIDSKKAFEGSSIIFEHMEYDENDEDADLFAADGLFDGDRCKIIKNLGKYKQEDNISLDKVILEIIE